MRDHTPKFVNAIVVKRPDKELPPDLKDLVPKYDSFDCVLVADNGDQYHTGFTVTVPGHVPTAEILIKFFNDKPDAFTKLPPRE